MDFFRAVPSNKVDLTRRYTRQETRRLPSNVPYFVDNIWEWLRPEGAPCRRHAAYASPTPELALENASADHLEKSEYSVFRLQFDARPVMHQLSKPDARDHSDIKAFQKEFMSVVGIEFAGLPLVEKLELAPLFMPGVSKYELETAAKESALLSKILARCQGKSTFWKDFGVIDAMSSGELFFELAQGEAYTLVPLS